MNVKWIYRRGKGIESIEVKSEEESEKVLNEHKWGKAIWKGYKKIGYAFVKGAESAIELSPTNESVEDDMIWECLAASAYEELLVG